MVFITVLYSAEASRLSGRGAPGRGPAPLAPFTSGRNKILVKIYLTIPCQDWYAAGMDEQELRKVVKAMLLAMSRLQESITALGIVLKEQGILDPAGYLSAQVMAHEMNRPTWEKLEKLETLDPMIELMRAFQGPVQ